MFGLTDWYRDGTLAEYVAVEARNLTPLPGDVDFMVGAALVMPGLTAWQGLFEHGRLHAGQSVLVHGAAGVVGSMASQLAREAGAYLSAPGTLAPVRRLSTSVHRSSSTSRRCLGRRWPSRSGFRCHRWRHREAVCRPDSRRRNASDHHRPDRGAALWRPNY